MACARSHAVFVQSILGEPMGKSGGRWSLEHGGEGSDVKDMGSVHPWFSTQGAPAGTGEPAREGLEDVPPAMPLGLPTTQVLCDTVLF